MALLSHGMKDKEFDVRMISRGIGKGTLTQEDVEKNKKKLPDDSENAAYTNIEVLMEEVKAIKH